MLRRLIPLLILAVGVALFVLLRLTRPEPESVSPGERSWQVAALEVTLSEQQPTLPLFGEIVSPGMMTMTASLAGRVAERPVREGQRVESGELLVALDQADVQPLIDQAEADLAEFEARIESERLRHANDEEALARERELLESARRQLERTSSLMGRNLASQADLDTARDALARAQLTVTARTGARIDYPQRLRRLEAGLERAWAALAMVRRDARRSRLEAPFEGVVTGIQVAPGDRVAVGATLLSLYPLAGLEIRARIPYRYQDELISALEDGHALDAFDEEGLRYRLVGLAGRGDPAGTEAILEAVESSSDLRPGSLIPVMLQRPPVPDALAVPHSALYGNDTLYLVDDEQRMERIEVTRHGELEGPDGERWLVVTSDALEEGQRVVITHLPSAIEGLKLVLGRGGDDE
jgi:multidrug efflux pump subunit AcrA (membrane-fusion protein)